MTIVVQQHPGFVDFLNERIGLSMKSHDVKTVTDLSNDGKILAVVGFMNYSGSNVETCVAFTDGYQVTRRMIKTCIEYAFNTLGVKRITGIVHEKNTKVMEINRRMGFILETPTPLRDWFEDGDAYIYGLLRSNCKWLR